MLRISFLIVILSSCTSRKENVQAEQSMPAGIEAITFQSEYGGFGYNILVRGKTIIHQPNIPAVATHKGFPTEQSARKAADLVIRKIKTKGTLPALTIDEVNAAIMDENINCCQ